MILSEVTHLLSAVIEPNHTPLQIPHTTPLPKLHHKATLHHTAPHQTSPPYQTTHHSQENKPHTTTQMILIQTPHHIPHATHNTQHITHQQHTIPHHSPLTTPHHIYGWFPPATAKICWWKLQYCNRCHFLTWNLEFSLKFWKIFVCSQIQNNISESFIVRVKIDSTSS